MKRTPEAVGRENLESIVGLQQKIIPEMRDLLEKRYELLKHISYHGPIGRRALAAQMDLSESGIRNDIRTLKETGMLEMSLLGVTVTPAGREVIAKLRRYVNAMHGLLATERDLEQKLAIPMVKIVPGDSEKEDCVLQELGRVTARVLDNLLKPGMVVAVSGGSTMAAVAGAVRGRMPDILVVPTRGGLGEQVERQANSVAVAMAGNLGGNYRLLHIPEGINDAAMRSIRDMDSSIGEIEALIQSADILIHSIGRADVMVHRRNHASEVASDICSRGAGEALGHYYSADGECIHTYSTNGFRLDNLAGIGKTIAVAGGKQKAAAVVSVIKANSRDVLVIDEAAARAIQLIIQAEGSQKTF